MHAKGLTAIQNTVTAVKNKVTGQLKQWEGRQIRTDLKTASIALTSTAILVGIAVGSTFLYQKHRQ